MTSAVVLSRGAVSVDLTSLNVSVTHRYSNPIIFLPTPAAAGSTIGSNIIAINIGFFNNSFDVSFQLTDGPGTFNFSSPSTNYEKIMYLTADPDVGKQTKTLTLNGTAFVGHIENVSIPFRPGQKNLVINGSLAFRLTKDLPM
jgi:hypothetical protein